MAAQGEYAKITGVVERIVFFNEENFYCVATVKTRAQGRSENITITGTMPSLQCGETIDVEGEWARHGAYGRQLKVKSFSTRLPSGVYGIEKYLGSGLIDGIGPKYAKRIVDHRVRRVRPGRQHRCRPDGESRRRCEMAADDAFLQG